MKRGERVEITFLDHVEAPGEAKAERFLLTGWVVRVNRRAVIIATWRYANKRRKFDENTTTYAILRSTIEKVQKLEPVE